MKKVTIISSIILNSISTYAQISVLSINGIENGCDGIDDKIYIKIHGPIWKKEGPIQNPGRTFLLDIDESNEYDWELIQTEVKRYYSDYLSYNMETNYNELALDVNDISILDGITVIGNDYEKISKLLLDDANDDLGTYFRDKLVFKEESNALELADPSNVGIFSFVNLSKLSSYYLEAFKKENYEQVLGFTIFHAQGHNSGLTHIAKLDPIQIKEQGLEPNQNKGYMNSAEMVRLLLSGSTSAHENYHPYYCGSIEEIISWTINDVKVKHRNKFNVY